MTKTVLGIIGGSGVYDISGLEGARWQRVDSPWGEVSDELLLGKLSGVEMVFLPRHGRGHVHSPNSINYRANIDALKRAGCTDVISVSACGSLKEELPPGHFVLADQFIDRTHARDKSFFVRGWWARSKRPPAAKTSAAGAAEPISRWKVRNFPRSRNPSSIARGAATSS